MPRQQLRQEELLHRDAVSMTSLLPSEPLMRARISVAFRKLPPLLYCSLAYTSLRIPWEQPLFRAFTTCFRTKQRRFVRLMFVTVTVVLLYA